jgi:hypothetical protein
MAPVAHCERQWSEDGSLDYTPRAVKSLMCRYTDVLSACTKPPTNYGERVTADHQNARETLLIALADFDRGVAEAGLTPREKQVVAVLTRGFARLPGETVEQYGCHQLDMTQQRFNIIAWNAATRISKYLSRAVVQQGTFPTDGVEG